MPINPGDPGPTGWANGVNASLAGKLNATTAASTYVPQAQAQPSEGTNVVLFKVAPKTAGWGAFKAVSNSYANADASYNHAAFIGWNPSDTSPHGAEVAGKVALVIGWEDNFYDGAGDGNHGPEFYVEQQTPNASATMFRPIYMRGSNETGHNRWNIQFDMGTDATGPNFGVYAGKLNPPIFSVTPTQVTTTKNLVVSAANFTLAPGGTGQPILGVNGVNPAIVLRDAAGAQTWLIQSQGVNNLTFADRFSRNHMILTQGGSVTAALSDFASSVKVQGNVGFYNTAPVARPAAPVTLADVIAVIRGCGLSA